MHKNQHTKSKVLCFIKRSNDKLAKIGHFQFSESIFNVKNQLNQRTLEHLERKLLEVFCKSETSRDIKKYSKQHFLPIISAI